MKDSLRQASLLFRSRPFTWLPVLLATILTFALRRIENILSFRILIALLPYSVLNHRPDFRALPLVAGRAVIYTIPLGFSVVFLVTLAYAVALLVVSAMVREHPGQPRPQVLTLFRSHWKRLRAFCLKTTALYFVPGFFVTFLLVSTRPFANSGPLANDFLQLLHLIVAFVVARWSLPLLRSANSRAVPDSTLTQAGMVSVLAIILSIFLDVFLAIVERPWMTKLHATGLAVVGVAFGNALIECFPIVFLFLILSVLAAQDDYLA